MRLQEDGTTTRSRESSTCIHAKIPTYTLFVKKKYRHLCKTICAEFLPRTMLGIKKFSNPSVRTIKSEFFIEQSITILINSSCNVRTYHLQQQNNMYTKDSDIWFDDEKIPTANNIMFHATSTMEHKKTIAALSA